MSVNLDDIKVHEDDSFELGSPRAPTPLPRDISDTPTKIQQCFSHLKIHGPTCLIVLFVTLSTVSGWNPLLPLVSLTLATVGTFSLFSFLWDGLQGTETNAAELKKTIHKKITDNRPPYDFDLNITNKITDPELIARFGRVASQLGIAVNVANYIVKFTTSNQSPDDANSTIGAENALLVLNGLFTLTAFIAYIQSGKGMFELTKAEYEVDKLIIKDVLEETRAELNEERTKRLSETPNSPNESNLHRSHQNKAIPNV